MPARKVDDATLLAALEEVFRTHGYEGASVSRIVAATGLERASLYHRFPGGKAAMARAVLEGVRVHLANHVLAPLEAEGNLAKRLRAVARRLAQYYGKGARSCPLDSLSLGLGRPQEDAGAADSLQPEHVAADLAATAGVLLEGLAAAARTAGAKPKVARRRAEEAVARLQGGLVLARVTGNRRAFRRAVKSLPRLIVDGVVEC